MEKSQAGSQKQEFRTPNLLGLAFLDLQTGIPRTILPTVLFVVVASAGLYGATLRGTVLDPNGRAIRGARVSLLTPLKASDVCRSDAEGKYSFSALGPGDYQLVATAPGLSAPPARIALKSGDNATVDLRLQLSALHESVIVSASLGGALAPEIGSSVSVVTRTEMDQRGVPNALEALRGIPGLDVNQTGRWGGATGVFIRGGNSNYNLVMVDGIPLNQFGGDFDFASLPSDGVERIEVLRGPESALYGSNAVTGVINILSRRGDGPPHFSALAEGGSFNTHRYSVGASGLTRGWGWSADVSRLISQGVVANDRYRDQSAFFSLGYRRDPRRRLDFHFFGNANDAGAPGPYGSDPDHLFFGVDTVSRDKQNLFGYALNYAEDFSPRFRQVTTATLATNDYYFHSPYGDSFSNNWRAAVSTRSEVVVSNRDFLVAGVEYGRERVQNTYIADANNSPFTLPRSSLAFFVENRWTPTPRLFVNAGARVDVFRTAALPPDAFGTRPLLPANSVTQVDPRISVAYLVRESRPVACLGATRLHGSFGTGIREPSGFELAFTNNPRLRPERNVSFDFGIEQRFFGNRALVDATYFYNRFQDQIVVLGGSLTNLSTFTSANLGNSRAQGLELSFRLQPARALELSGTYTLDATSLLAVTGTSVALSPFQVGQPLIRRPKNSGFFNVTWRHHRLMLNANAYVRGPALDIEPNLGTYACSLDLPCFFTNKGFTRADAGFSYRLPRGLEIYGRLDNLLNQKYEESLGYPALHLNFLAGMRFNFPAE